jgi:hypothetical protein
MKTTASGRPTRVAALALSFVVAVSLAAPGALNAGAAPRRASAVAAGRDGLDRALQQGRVTVAQHALQRALSLFDLDGVRARFGSVAAPEARSATLILRNLALVLDDLEGSDLRTAKQVLARPDGGGGGVVYTANQVFDRCSQHLCVHWVETTSDAPPLADDDGDDIPDWVELTQGVLENAWSKEVGGMGFRAPKSDQTSNNNGGNGKLDVYLADVGGQGLYGFVTTDDPHANPGSSYKYFDFSTYMVLDDDYAKNQFPGVTGAAALRVTVAHEFFHSVQAAYDFAEDGWFMEGTATWMEDQLYDSINDNLQYLSNSPLKKPSVPLDYFGSGFQYGNFIFWHFVSKRFSPARPAKPLRRIWQWADGSPGGPDLYSLRAVAKVSQAEGSSLRALFHGFGRCLLHPGACYNKGGRAYASRGHVPVEKLNLGPSTGRKKARTYSRDHLTTKYVLFDAGRDVGNKARLRVLVDLPKLKKGPGASLVYRKSGGRIAHLPFKLSKSGDGVRFAPIGKADHVYLVLSNGGSHFDCWRRTRFSCQGKPLDNNGRYGFRASLR